MQIPANPARIHMETIRAIGLELMLWLAAAIDHVARWSGSRAMRLWAQRETRDARRAVRHYLFLLAFARLRLPALAPLSSARGRRPTNTRRGFRYARRRVAMVKHMLRGVDLSSLKAIRRAMENADALAVRMAARMRWPAVTGAWVATRPPARTLVSLAPAPAAEAADTS